MARPIQIELSHLFPAILLTSCCIEVRGSRKHRREERARYIGDRSWPLFCKVQQSSGSHANKLQCGYTLNRLQQNRRYTLQLHHTAKVPDGLKGALADVPGRELEPLQFAKYPERAHPYIDHSTCEKGLCHPTNTTAHTYQHKDQRRLYKERANPY